MLGLATRPSLVGMDAPVALGYSTENCTVGRAMSLLGERWTVVILRELFNGIRRFADIQEHAGIPKQVLSDRLALLVDHGVVERVPYREPGARVRYEYRLTAKGLDLYPVVLAVKAWGDKYLADPEGTPVEIRHRDCGSRIGADVRCEAGHLLSTPAQAYLEPGPSAIPRDS